MSEMYIRTADHVEKPAYYVPISNDKWLQGKKNKSMVIPAGEKREYSTSMTIKTMLSRAAHRLGRSEADYQQVEIHSVNLHMHAIGASGTIAIKDKSGKKSDEILLDIPRWDIAWQRDFVLQKPKLYSVKSDLSQYEVAVSCRFENPRSVDVFGGFGSDDEMCFNFLYFALSPKTSHLSQR